MSNSNLKTIAIGLIGGAIASWVKAKVERPLQDFGEEMVPPSYEELELKGADAKNQPENMPPSVLANKVYKECTGNELTKQQKISILPYIHYGAGMLMGVGYVMAANRDEHIAFDGGITAGAVLWSITHGSTLPALGLQGKVKDMPASWWFWEFGSHLVFGITLEQSRKLLNKVI